VNSLFVQYEGVFEEKEEQKKDKPQKSYAYNPFPFQDAVGENNPKKAWIEYTKLVLSGVEPDELIHKVISKVREMVFINLGATADDLNIKPYAFSKSKSHFKNWGTKKLQSAYEELVFIYHNQRLGIMENDFSANSKTDIKIALEKFLLSL
jgi:hypothetical protein